MGCLPIILLKGVLYRENSRGPRTEHYGMPNNSSHNSERVDPIFIAWNQWLRKEMNLFTAVLATPNHDLRQLRRVSWSIDNVSKSAERSSKTSAAGSPNDSERWISFLICSKILSLERLVLYADCGGFSRLLLLTCCISCLTTTRYTNLDMKRSPDTG